MAKELVTRLRDDLDGSVGFPGETDIETIPFAHRGVNYEMELNPTNAAVYDAAMAPYLKVARKVKKTSHKRKPATDEVKEYSSPSRVTPEAEYRREVRDWASANPDRIERLGLNVPAPRGILAQGVIDAYEQTKRECSHPRTYADGPRKGQCTKCHELVDA